MIWFISATIFLFGLAIGSFLNAFIYRLEVQQGLCTAPVQNRIKGVLHPVLSQASIMRGRSFCPSCGHTLAWYDLIPLLSFVFLQGKCRYCKNKISLQYPFVELSAALLFLAIFAKLSSPVENLISLSFPQVGEIFYLWTVAGVLLVIFVYDLKHFIIPDRVLFPAIGLVALWRIFESISWFTQPQFPGAGFSQGVDNLTELSLINPLFAGVGAAAFFFAIHVLSRGRAMGFGDVKFALFMGLFLGFPNILVALFVSFILGALVGVSLILLKKKKMKSEVPFGPFLVLGTLIALFWGDAIVNFYMSFIL